MIHHGLNDWLDTGCIKKSVSLSQKVIGNTTATLIHQHSHILKTAEVFLVVVAVQDKGKSLVNRLKCSIQVQLSHWRFGPWFLLWKSFVPRVSSNHPWLSEGHGSPINSPLIYQGDLRLTLLLVHKSNYSVMGNSAGFGIGKIQIEKSGFVTRYFFNENKSFHPSKVQLLSWKNENKNLYCKDKMKCYKYSKLLAVF